MCPACYTKKKFDVKMKLGTISSLFGFTYEIASASACLLRVTDTYCPHLSLSLYLSGPRNPSRRLQEAGVVVLALINSVGIPL